MTVIVIYGDFNCPYSYLASLRSDLFSAAGVEIDWRAVEHASSLPVMGQRLDDAGQRKIADELDSVRQLLTPEEAFAAATPSTLPNTAAANAGYAEAVGSEVGDDVRRLLFDAYWGFITFFVWVAFKQTSNIARVLWFVAIMLLGNIAMSAYCLNELFRTPRDGKLADVLVRRRDGLSPLGGVLAVVGAVILFLA